MPAVEEGLVTLIGATTENPSFEVNRALLSRTRLYELAELTEENVLSLLRRAWSGASAARPRSSRPRSRCLRPGPAATRGPRSARWSWHARRPSERSRVEHAEDALQRRIVHYDKKADSHYDTISAWIKATRGSDPDASLYYLAVMLEGGEDPRFIARRMVILASEDVGNADPNALTVATGAAAAVEHAGLPECQFALAQAAIYLSLAPKSDAAKRAIGAARDFVREHGASPPPVELRSGGRGEGYDNPHAHPGHVAEQELAPEAAVGERFYKPDEAESELAKRLQEIRRARGR